MAKLTLAQFPLMIDPAVQEVFHNQLDMEDEGLDYLPFTNVKEQSLKDFKLVTVGTFDKLVETDEGDDYNLLTMYPHDSVTASFLKYTGRIDFTEEVVIWDTLDILANRVRLIAGSSAVKLLDLVWDQVNNALAGTTTGWDGVSTFNDTHPLSGGGSQDNLGAIALSATNLQTGINTIRNMQNDHGDIMNLRARDLCLLNNSANEVLAHQSVYGAYRTDDLSDENIIRRNVQIVSSPHFSDANGWALVPKAFKSPLHQYWLKRRDALGEMVDGRPDLILHPIEKANRDATYTCRMFTVAEWADYYGTYGSQGP